jgi:hypothetical protein
MTKETRIEVCFGREKLVALNGTLTAQLEWPKFLMIATRICALQPTDSVDPSSHLEFFPSLYLTNHWITQPQMDQPLVGKMSDPEEEHRFGRMC